MHPLLLPVAFITVAASVPVQSVAELPGAEEVEMALSAAPEHLRDAAGVYRLGSRDYELVRASRNGFNCLVAREPSMGLAPVCYDAEGSRTNMVADMMRGSLRRQGKSEEQVEAEVNAAYADGRLSAPARPGIAYMLSTHFTQIDRESGERRCIFPPHVMFYAPFLRNADIGAERRHFGSTAQPWVLNEGEPGAHVLVVSHGVDVNSCR